MQSDAGYKHIGSNMVKLVIEKERVKTANKTMHGIIIKVSLNFQKFY